MNMITRWVKNKVWELGYGDIAKIHLIPTKISNDRGKYLPNTLSKEKSENGRIRTFYMPEWPSTNL